MATTSPPHDLPPRPLQSAARRTLKVLVAMGAILLANILPLHTLYVVAVTVVALRLLLLPL